MANFEPGTIVRSIHTGKRVRVTGPGQDEGTFAGEYLHAHPQFNYHWHGWVASSFKPEAVHVE